MNTVILIDFSWLYNKYYFVAKQRQGNTCTITKDMLTQFLNRVYKSYKAFTYVVLDPPTKNTVNYSLNKAYKQQRDTSSKVEIYNHLPDVVKHLRLNLPPSFKFVKAKHYEADQLIAYLAEKYKDTHNVIVFSGDKDLLQLTYYNTVHVANQYKNGYFILLKDTEIYSKFSNAKKQDFTRISNNKKDILKYRVLKGDVSDNLPPLFPKIKDTEIQEIIKEYWVTEDYLTSDIIEDIVSSISKTNHKLYNKLCNSKELWLTNYKMMNLFNLHVDTISILR